MFFRSLALLSTVAALFSSNIAVSAYPTTSGKVWRVTVGNATGGTIFNPNYINASPGDRVEFTFNPKNHSVTQSSFANPCTHLNNGFDAGFHPVANASSWDLPTFSITVNDTKPVWVYCRQAENTAGSHCGKGMVFGLNPGAEGSNNSFSLFQQAALKIGQQLVASASSASVASTASATHTTIQAAASSSKSSSWSDHYDSWNHEDDDDDSWSYDDDDSYDNDHKWRRDY
ncbi:hypothetical protein BGW80DRAFT_1253702 [Lactifluus volemus]|nr:hypothetical protein BGW80DRAFT_1253702 [Lactifluus volemus]